MSEAGSGAGHFLAGGVAVRAGVGPTCGQRGGRGSGGGGGGRVRGHSRAGRKGTQKAEHYAGPL